MTMNIEDIKIGAIIEVNHKYNKTRLNPSDYGLYMVVDFKNNVYVDDGTVDGGAYVTHAICYHFEQNSTVGVHPSYFAKYGVLVSL